MAFLPKPVRDQTAPSVTGAANNWRHQLGQLQQALTAGHGQRPDFAKLRQEHADVLQWAAVNYLGMRAPRLSAGTRLSRGQSVIGLILAAAVASLIAVNPRLAIITFNSCFILFCCLTIGFRSWMLASSLKAGVNTLKLAPAIVDTDLPVITLLVPLYREEKSLPGLIKALNALDYPQERLDIKILLEEDDVRTLRRARQLCRQPHFDVVIVPESHPRTKPKACNYGLWTAIGEFIVIYDAEDRPDPDQLRKAVAAFRHGTPRLACVQARLNYYNRHQNWLTRLFSMEYSVLFDISLPALHRSGAPIPLGGTSNFFRTETLRHVGGWDAYNVTEDADLGLRLARLGYEVGVIQSTTYEEAVSHPWRWVRQRSRWIKGYMQTWLVHTRSIGKRPKKDNPLKRFITLHLFIGGVIVAALINPIFWILYGSWLSGTAPWLESIFPFPLMEISLVSLLAGNALMAYMTLVAPLERRWYDHCGYVALIPVYWLLMAIAGYIALWQLIVRPFYWDKTEHGFHQGTGELEADTMAKLYLVTAEEE